MLRIEVRRGQGTEVPPPALLLDHNSLLYSPPRRTNHTTSGSRCHRSPENPQIERGIRLKIGSNHGPLGVPDFLQGVLTDGFQGTGYLHLFYGARLDRQECN